jgi:hypothetical protein
MIRFQYAQYRGWHDEQVEFGRALFSYDLGEKDST